MNFDELCRANCITTKTITVCNLPSLVRLRKVGEADDLTMLEMSNIDEGIILDIDYIREEELNG